MTRLLLPLLLITGLGFTALPARPAIAFGLDDLQKQLTSSLEKLDKMRGKVSTEEEIEIGGNDLLQGFGQAVAQRCGQLVSGQRVE